MSLTEYIESFNFDLESTGMDYFDSELIKEGEFCINAKMYYVFIHILTKQLNNKIINDSDYNINRYKYKNIKKQLHRSELVENIDYKVFKMKHSWHKLYMITPKAFKILLMDMPNFKIRKMIFKYYLFLEDCVKTYD